MSADIARTRSPHWTTHEFEGADNINNIKNNTNRKLSKYLSDARNIFVDTKLWYRLLVPILQSLIHLLSPQA